jgi:hypothetical protein
MHICSTATQEIEAGRSVEPMISRPAWARQWDFVSKKKYWGHEHKFRGTAVNVQNECTFIYCEYVKSFLSACYAQKMCRRCI